MSLSNQLKAYTREYEKNSSKEYLQITDWSIRALKSSDLLKRSLKTSDSLPNGTLINEHGKPIQIYDLLKQTSLVITFYRGGWCPFCNLQLKALQRILPDIVEKGASLVAITPELPANSIKTKEHNYLNFTILSDVDNKYATALSLAYDLPSSLLNLYHDSGINLKSKTSNVDAQLPIPATYVVNQAGEITYHFLDPDYKNRAELEHIINAL
jgi:peroxiredoxin